MRKKKSGQSIRASFARSLGGLKKYSLLIFLPLIFGLILVPAMLHLVNQQMDRYGSLTSDFFESRMTIEMESIESVCSILNNDGRLAAFLANEAVSLEDERTMIERIASSVARNDNIREIYLLDGIHKHIYSSEAAYNYSPENTVITSSEMSTMDLNNKETGWHMMNEDGSVPYYLLHAERIAAADVDIIAVFDRELMKDIISSVDAETGAVFNDDGYVSLIRDPDVDWTSDESVSKAAGTTVKCFYSEKNGFRFVAALAYRDYRKPLTTVLWIFVIYFTAVIIAGMIYLAVVSKREMESWQELAQMIPDQEVSGKSTSSEEIREGVLKSLKTYQKSQDQYAYEQESHIVRQLLKSRIPEPDQNIYEKAGIPSDAPAYCVLSISADDYSDMMFDESGEIRNIDYSRVIFRSILENAADGRVTIGTAGLGKIFAAIMCFSDGIEPKETAFDIARKSAEYIESNYGLNLHIAISSIYDSLAASGQAYEETEALQEYMSFIGEESAIVTPDSLKSTSEEYEKSGFTGQLHMLESILEAEKYDYVPRMVSDILDQYVEPLKKNYRIARSRINTVGCILAEAVMYSKIDKADTIDLSEKVRSAETSGQLKKATEEVFERITALYAENADDDPVNQACRYMDEHFTEPDLQVADICGFVGMSAQHLNRLFHKKLGMNVTACLQKKRISHAKILLEETDVPVADIAVQSGYNSQNSFAYNFRNQEKLSPGGYREWVREHKASDMDH